MTSKGARVLLSMPKAFLKQIDQVAQEEQRSRSELFREVMRQYLNQKKEQKRSRYSD